MTDSARSAIPVPDPTLLTTASLKLAIENLKELVFTKLDAVSTLEGEKFKELHQRLELIETRRQELKADAKDALDVAMTAQVQLFEQRNKSNEEAASKSEASFTKQIESISKEAALAGRALSDRIEALKERIDRGTGKETGRENQESQARERMSWVVPVVVLGTIAVLNLILNLLPWLHGVH